MTKKELSVYFDTVAETLLSHTRKRSYYYKNVEKLVRFFVPEGQTVLEMGTGVGDLLAAVKPKKGIGIDLSAKILAIARKAYPDLSFFQMDAESMSFDDKFDYLIASDLVGYLDDIQKAFDEAYRLSHRRTRFVITCYNKWWELIIKLAELLRIKRPRMPIQNWLSIADIENLLSLSGFSVIRKGKRILFPINIPLISGFFNKFLAYLPKDIKWVVQNGIGKRDAVEMGFEMAQGDILMILDADLSVEPEEMTKFYNVLVCGKSEYVQGTRLVYPMRKQAMRFINYLGNNFFSVWVSWILDQRVTDTLCGTKVLFKEDYEKIKQARDYWGQHDPFGDFDLLLGASKQNLEILEIPIRYQERKYGSTNKY